MLRIPRKNRDLRRHVVIRTTFRVVGYLLWLAIWYGGALAYNYNHQTYPYERQMTGWRMAVWMAISVLMGIILFRMWKLFTERTIQGVIEQSGLSHSYSASGDPGALDGMDYDFRLNTYLKVRTPNGKLRRIRFEQKNGFYMYYHEGNHIIRFRGLTYPLNTDPRAPHGNVCSACGAWSKTRSSHCPVCDLSTIDPNDLSTDPT